METPIAITFIAYLVFLLAIGLFFWYRNHTVDARIIIGLFIGTVLNWGVLYKTVQVKLKERP